MLYREIINEKLAFKSKVMTFGLLVCACFLSSCSSFIDTPSDTKHLQEFHAKYFSTTEDILQEDKLQLYVDCSTCNALGQNSKFYQMAITPSLVSATKKYYSIEGKQIVEQDANQTYTLLRSIKEVNFADLKTAAERIADGNTEGALITDGEYYEPSIAAGNITNPYMTKALKTWLLKGHDIYIILEPYQEPYKGQVYNKKRFYFLFTDSRIPNNIWNRISQTANLQNYPDVDIFHLAISRPFVQAKPGADSSTPNEVLAAKVQRNGMCEIQDWSVDWNPIEKIIIGAVDENTGKPLPNGDKVISGLSLDKNSFGALKIEGVEARVYNINSLYNEFYICKEEKTPIASNISIDNYLCPGFLTIDKNEFNKHSSINLYFDANYYSPDILLDGKPYNYSKIDLFIKDVRNVFSQYSKMFEFTSIDCQPGQTNVSVEKSVEQCLADPVIMNQMKQTPFYTIYVKSNKK